LVNTEENGKEVKRREKKDENLKNFFGLFFVQHTIEELPVELFMHQMQHLFVESNGLQLESSTPLIQITAEYGWQGLLTYEKAKTTLQGAIFDDDSNAVYLTNNPNIIIKVDWDSKNSDLCVYLTEEGYRNNKFVEIYQTPSNEKSITLWSTPKEVIGIPCYMKCSCNDLEYPVHHDNIIVSIYDKVNSTSISVLGIINPKFPMQRK